MNARTYFGLTLAVSVLHAAANPTPPLLVSPASNALSVSTSPSLQVKVADSNRANLTVRFYGRLAVNPGPDFTIAALPDTQYYSSSMNGGSPAILAAQTDFIASNRAASNIVYVAGLGDIVNYGDTNAGVEEITAWKNATNAYYRLENPATTGLPGGLPYGAAVGNHDQSPNGSASGTTRYYNQYFGISHFAGRSYYGGHYGTNNDNHFDLFSASGIDFIAIFMEYDVNATKAVLTWANELLRTNANRRGIVVSHYLTSATTPANFGAQGAAIYNALKTNANLALMLCGHVSGEGSRVDVFNGNSVATLLADYQSYANGGNGFLRLLQFSPSNSVLQVRTYSPWLKQFETDADSQFSLPFVLPPGVPAPDTNFLALGTNYNVASDSTNSLLWPELLSNHTYEWYVTVSDAANNTVTSPLWRFTTRSETAPKGVAAGLLQVSQIPGAVEDNTNCLVNLALGINTFQIGTCNRGDYNVQAGWSATDDSALGVLISSVAQNGRNNFGSNVFCTCCIATNATGSYRIASHACPNAAAGDGFEYNVNVAGAWFPYAEYWGGVVGNSGGANAGDWDCFIGSPGLKLGTHLVSLGGGKGIVNLTSLGIDARTDGVLLVNHAKDEGNYALAQVNSANGTWNVFIHDNSTDGGSYEQDPLAFVFVPRTNTALISGRFLGNGTPLLYSGSAPQFAMTNIATGRWELTIPGYSPANGVLILSAEGGSSGNQDNIVSYEPSTNGRTWIIESRDLPACILETPGGGSEPVASFVFIPAPPPGLTVSPTNLITTEAGGTASFSAVLNTPPAADVLLTITSDDPSEGTVSPTTLTFTTNNWNVPQLVVVTGVDDQRNDGDVTYSVLCSFSSSDPLYALLPPVVVIATNLDDEQGLSLPSGDLFYGVGMPAITLDGRATVVDPAVPNYDTGSLTVTLTANGTADDRLEIRSTGTGAGQIGVSGNVITYGGTGVGSYTGGQGTTPLVVTFTPAMTRAAAEALVRAITFRIVGMQPSLNPRTVSVVLVDGNDLASSASKAIRVGQARLADFQQGVDGGYGAYTSAANLELYQSNPNTVYPAGHSSAGLWSDYPDNANACQLLLRFDNIIGNGLGQIPPNAIVVSAELMLVINDTGDGSPLYRMLRSWNAATDTWNTLSSGVQLNDIEARSTYDSQLGSSDGAGTGTGAVWLGVTPDVQAWVNGQANYGWVLPGWPGINNGTAYTPSQTATVANRPRLRVKWLPAGTPAASFRQGVNGYTSAVDTRIRENAPDSNFATVTSMFIDAGVTSTTDPEQILLRFDKLVGSGTSQVPAGSRVEAAVLDLAAVVGNAPGAGGNFHALLLPWQDTTTTWNSWNNGIQADDVEAAATPSVTLGNPSLTPKVQGAFYALDVTPDVQTWVSGTRTNYGWVGLPWPGGTDGWGIATAESTVERNRPQLRIYYTSPANQPLCLLPPVWNSTHVQVRFNGAAGATYTVQRASGLGASWSTLGTATVGPDGLGLFNDASPVPGTAFYRIRYP
jgi:hypothetical protein